MGREAHLSGLDGYLGSAGIRVCALTGLLFWLGGHYSFGYSLDECLREVGIIVLGTQSQRAVG